MRRFEHVLRRLDAELISPEPWRTQALVEIGGDLEEAYAAYRARGLGEAEAAERAAAMLGLNETTTARELSELHTPRYVGWLTRVVHGSGYWETMALTMVTVAALAGAGVALRGAVTLQAPGVTMWLLYGIVGVLAWQVAAAVLASLSAAPGGRSRLESCVRRLPLIAGVAVVVSTIGACARVRGSVTEDSTATWSSLIVSMGGAAEVLAAGLSIAVCALLAWFHLYRRALVVRLLQAELQRIIDPAGEEAG